MMKGENTISSNKGSSDALLDRVARSQKIKRPNLALRVKKAKLSNGKKAKKGIFSAKICQKYNKCFFGIS
jgi:hypothetical protein